MAEPGPSGHTAEARRILTICNACRYCEGLCATFQAVTLRRSFAATDLDYLANLCHQCTQCFHNCQYAPPHAFDVNVPRTLAALRIESWERFAWPGFLAASFRRNALVVSLLTAAILAAILVLATALVSPGVLFGEHRGPGAFYLVVSKPVMTIAAGSTFAWSLVAITIGAARFLGAGDRTVVARGAGDWRAALRDAASMKYLDGGLGDGCSGRDERASNLRRYYHQASMWGFLLCFASTAIAAVYDYGLGRAAPYPVASIPVLLGMAGGIGLLAGTAGLFREKLKSDRRTFVVAQYGMDYALLALLFLVSLTGFGVLVLRETAAMGLLLLVHLGFVLAFFVALPYSKFVHAAYRLAALARFAAERANPGY